MMNKLFLSKALTLTNRCGVFRLAILGAVSIPASVASSAEENINKEFMQSWWDAYENRIEGLATEYQVGPEGRQSHLEIRLDLKGNRFWGSKSLDAGGVTDHRVNVTDGQRQWAAIPEYDPDTKTPTGTWHVELTASKEVPVEKIYDFGIPFAFEQLTPIFRAFHRQHSISDDTFVSAKQVGPDPDVYEVVYRTVVPDGVAIEVVYLIGIDTGVVREFRSYGVFPDGTKKLARSFTLQGHDAQGIPSKTIYRIFRKDGAIHERFLSIQNATVNPEWKQGYFTYTPPYGSQVFDMIGGITYRVGQLDPFVAPNRDKDPIAVIDSLALDDLQQVKTSDDTGVDRSSQPPHPSDSEESQDGATTSILSAFNLTVVVAATLFAAILITGVILMSRRKVRS